VTITSVIKDGGRLVIVEDGITKTRSIVYDDAVCSLPPTGYTEVGVIYVDETNSKLVVQYNGTTAEIELGAAGDLTGAEIVALLQALAANDRLEVTYLKDGTTYIKYTATEKTKLTSIEDSAKDDQTGAEIIALLEALTAGNRLSHSKLDDVGASDHHSKYTNAEAKAAAVQAGAITNGVTKAPTHDAVYDVKATADAALPADEKYTDEDAVGAMGVKADDNPLNHDRTVEYTDEDAVSAMGAKADDNPLNHDQAEEWGAAEHSAIGNGTPHHAQNSDTDLDATFEATFEKVANKDAANGYAGLDASSDIAESAVPEHMSKNKLGFTADKLLKGAGVGANPTEIDVPSGGYTEGAKVYNNAAQALGTGTDATINFNTELWDTDSIHDNVTNNSRLTCKTAGKYLIVASLAYVYDNIGLRVIQIRKNNITNIASYHIPTITVLNWQTTLYLAVIADMSVNDYVELKGYQDCGHDLNTKVSAYQFPTFYMQRIG